MSNREEQKTDEFETVVPSDNHTGDEKQYSQDPELDGWIKEGINKLTEKDYRDAIRLFEKVLRVDPDNMIAFEKLSIARSVQGDLDRINEYLAMGRELMNQRDWRSASEEFEAILVIDPDHEEAKASLSQAKKHLDGDSEEPEMVITTGGESVFDFGTSISDPNLEIEQETSLLETYTPGSIDDVSDNPEFQRELEEALRIYENGNLESARTILEGLQEKFPGQPQVQFYLTAIARRLENDSVREDQANAETLFNEAMDLLEKQDFTGAKSKFQRVLVVKPEFEQAKLMLDRVGEMEKLSGSSFSSTSSKTSAGKPMPKKHTPKPVSQIPKPRHHRSGMNTPVIVFGGFAAVVVLGVIAFFMFQYPTMRFEKLVKEAQERYRSKAYTEAAVLLESALAVKPESKEQIVMLGDALSHSGKFGDAVTAYSNALDLDPTDKELEYKVAEAYFAEEQWADAISYYEKLTNNLKYNEKARFKIGLAQTRIGRIDDAIASFQKSIELNDAFAEAHFELAELYNKTELFEEAEEQYKKAINSDPKFIKGYEILSDFYMVRERPADAAITLERLLAWFKPTTLEKSEHVASLKFKLGVAQYDSEAYDQAVDSFTSVIQIDPDVEAFRNLGRCHYKSGRLHEAIMVWRRGLELNSDDYDLWFRIGVAQFRLGELGAAETSYQEALRVKPDYVKALTNLGFLYQQLYKFELARVAWRRSLEIDPNQEVVKRKLKEIEKK